MRRKYLAASIAVACLTACAPPQIPTEPRNQEPTPSASPTPGVCFVQLPGAWTNALAEAKTPTREGRVGRVIHVATDGATLVTVSDATTGAGSPRSSTTPQRTDTATPHPTTTPGEADDRPSPTNSPPTAPSQPAPSAVATASPRPADGTGAAELWYFERDFSNGVKVMTAPSRQSFLGADFDGRFYALLVGTNAERGASIYVWDAFGREEPHEITSNDQGKLTAPMIDQGTVSWGQTAANDTEGALVRYQLSTRNRSIVDRTHFGPGTTPVRSGTVITWGDDRGRFRSVDLHSGAQLSVPTQIGDLRGVTGFSAYRELWLWSTQDDELYAWHSAWMQPEIVRKAAGLRDLSVGDNYAVYATNDGVFVWDARAQSVAQLVHGEGSARLFGPWLVVQTAEKSMAVDTRRLPPLVPC